MTRHTYTTSLNRGGDTPTWEATFSYVPGRSDEIDDVRLEAIDGRTQAWSNGSREFDHLIAAMFQCEIEDSDTHLIAMMEIAVADLVAAEDRNAT